MIEMAFDITFVFRLELSRGIIIGKLFQRFFQPLMIFAHRDQTSSNAVNQSHLISGILAGQTPQDEPETDQTEAVGRAATARRSTSLGSHPRDYATLRLRQLFAVGGWLVVGRGVFGRLGLGYS
jgi:hypothetical protein